MLKKLKIVMPILLWVTCLQSTAQDNQTDPDSLLREGRILFVQSVEDESRIEPALDLFEKISNDTGYLSDRAMAYRGALYAIKAKHSFFPFDKLKWAKKGLGILDEALSQAPEDIEVLFVHGTICHNLPGLFRRQDDARRDFVKIIDLLPAHMHKYDNQFIADVIDYLNKEISLNQEEQKIITQISSNLPIAAGETE